ncbi:MAG: bifunctional adenosylcobinamide kinase/adenosylcobinamide-phosphate guanylyltransferase [Rhizobiaceae bacterium]|jgi:adenosylcobinamide kinase/adenosylcobinamide-phosphate guanylyltransferase|nr:bifunctional adenosylcobinamide kinase/adenosylcobinamide-phosphate guanylyltransferase [Rhizobiaceae bacterium]
MPAPLTLVLGGARSGKSRHAEALVTATGLARIYVATAQAWDDEMAARIARHRADRGDGWMTVDAPLNLADAITLHARRGHAVLVDCLTLWLTNVMLAEQDIETEFAALEMALAKADAPVMLVSNEVGLGIVPDNRLARAFRDHAGRLHQRLAQKATNVHFIAAGLPLVLKGTL